MVDRRPPCPAPAGEAKGIAIVTLSPGVCEREKVKHFLDFRSAVGWAKERAWGFGRLLNYWLGLF